MTTTTTTIPKLYYFGVKARAQLAFLILEYARAKYEWEKPQSWQTMKEQTPFGQLPVLEDGKVRIGQSMAIARYLAKKYDLSGESLLEYALSEQLIEEQLDIFNLLVKLKSATNEVDAMKTLLDIDLPKHFFFLERLIEGEGPYFCGKKPLVGDLAIFSVLNLVQDLHPAAFDSFPKLSKFYSTLSEDEGVKKFMALELTPALKRN